MFYEEKIINGILMYRITPDGDWTQVSATKMTSRIASLEEREKILKHEKETLGNDLDEAFDLVCKSDFINQRELLNILERNDNLYGLE